MYMRDKEEMKKCHEQAKQNGRTPHVESLAHKHKLNETWQIS